MKLKTDLPHFIYEEINAMRLPAPKYAYSQLYLALTGKKVSAIKAQRLLETYFNEHNSSKNYYRYHVVY